MSAPGNYAATLLFQLCEVHSPRAPNPLPTSFLLLTRYYGDSVVILTIMTDFTIVLEQLMCEVCTQPWGISRSLGNGSLYYKNMYDFSVRLTCGLYGTIEETLIGSTQYGR